MRYAVRCAHPMNSRSAITLYCSRQRVGAVFESQCLACLLHSFRSPSQLNFHVVPLRKQHRWLRSIATAHVQKQKVLPVMGTKTINLRVSADAAEVYESASAEEKRKLEALVSSRLREAARHRERGQTLEEIMSELSRNAQKRGLTPKKLADILNEE